MSFDYTKIALFQRFPIIAAIIAQLISLFFIKFVIQLTQKPIHPILFTIFQVLLSVFISQFVFKLPRWFFYISLFLPLAIGIGLQTYFISSGMSGLIFIFLVLTFSHTFKERVPLYLTNSETCLALKKIMEANQAESFLDLGSGLGGVVRSLAGKKTISVGVETAPILWFFSSILSFILGRGKIRRMSIWDTNLGEFDVVYAFLSPAVMERLNQKAQREMKPKSILVSNSFQFPGIEPSEIWQLQDERKTLLFLYQFNIHSQK